MISRATACIAICTSVSHYKENLWHQWCWAPPSMTQPHLQCATTVRPLLLILRTKTRSIMLRERRTELLSEGHSHGSLTQALLLSANICPLWVMTCLQCPRAGAAQIRNGCRRLLLMAPGKKKKGEDSTPGLSAEEGTTRNQTRFRNKFALWATRSDRPPSGILCGYTGTVS